MQIITTQKIDSKDYIISIEPDYIYIDPARTMKQIEPLLQNISEKDILQKRKEFAKQYAIYFPLKENQYKEENEKKCIDIQELLSQSRRERKLLTKDLELVTDNRNKKYWIKKSNNWEESICKTVIFPEGAILPEDLTEEQKTEIIEQAEKKRLSELKPEDKNKELEAKKEILLSQAVNLKSKLEITEDSQALKKSQDWYKTELAKLEKKYK